jgi:hypothetical protein
MTHAVSPQIGKKGLTEYYTESLIMYRVSDKGSRGVKSGEKGSQGVSPPLPIQ